MGKITFRDFEQSLHEKNPPADLCEELKALWYIHHGSWDKAHDIAQDIHSEMGSAIHAYLHRIEGDPGNAKYWYSVAGRPVFKGTEEEEWQDLVDEALTKM